MSDLGICEYCKYLDKDVTQEPCLHCSSNLGAFEFDISEHDKQIIADEREQIIAELEKAKKSLVGKYNGSTPMLEMPSYKVAFNNGIDKALEIVRGEVNEQS